ncbi:hypothetical protein [Anaerostipes sp.]|uniref:hypothetical protein n=1 Tax=Anaerostipes sp. TaxID=1872530 RepID=UPI0035286FFD
MTLSNPLGEHSWDEGKVTKKATCTEDGEKTIIPVLSAIRQRQKSFLLPDISTKK